MNKRRVLAVSVGILFIGMGTVLNAQWAKTLGGNAHSRAFSVQPTRDGGYVVAGYTNAFASGGDDYWVVKINGGGNIEWQEAYGGNNQEWGFSIQQTNDDGYIMAGCTYSFGAGGRDVWVIKLNRNGEVVWQKAYGGAKDERGLAIQQTFDGGYVVAGETNSFGDGTNDMWLLKLTPAGDIEWQRNYGRNYDDFAFAVTQTHDGGFMVGGSLGGRDCFLKLTPLGEVRWATGFIANTIESVRQMPDENFIVAGYRYGDRSAEFCIAKVDRSGFVKWEWVYGGDNNDYARSVWPTRDGGYIVAGETASYGAGKKDAWVLKLDSSGRIVWQRTYGDTGDDEIRSIQQTSDGGYIAAGTTASFGSGTENFFVLKIEDSGALDPACKFQKDSTVIGSWYQYQPPDFQVNSSPTAGTATTTQAYTTDTTSIAYDACSGKYVLTITAGYGGTTDPAPGSYQHDPGSVVSIRAIPSTNYQFSGWSGDVSGGANPLEITMDSRKSISASFYGTGGNGGGGAGGGGGGSDWGDGGGGGGGGDWGGGGGGGGGCFIATAAYGSQLHPVVKMLREFRDRRLVTNMPGRELVKLYYRFSPPLARRISRHGVWRFAARLGLAPFVALAIVVLHLGYAGTAAAVGLFSLPVGLRAWRRRRDPGRQRR